MKRKATTRKRSNPIDPFSLMTAGQGFSAVDKWRRKLSTPKKKRPVKRTRKNGRLAGRKNSADSVEQATERYEAFHGHGPEEFLTVRTKLHHHSALSGLGELMKLKIITDDGRKVTLSGFGGSILCQNAQATQLFIEGGDQSVTLDAFGIYEPFHETEVLGRCERVIYYTTKDHLTPETGGTANYNHKFGGVRQVNVNGKTKRKRSPLPVIVYDVRNKLLSFAGGGYTIPDEGIAN